MSSAIVVGFKPKFFRHYNKLSRELREEVDEAVQRFRANPGDPKLKIHKLKGRLRGELNFSVNYSHRILFYWEDSKKAILLAVGDHDVYK